MSRSDNSDASILYLLIITVLMCMFDTCVAHCQELTQGYRYSSTEVHVFTDIHYPLMVQGDTVVLPGYDIITQPQVKYVIKSSTRKHEVIGDKLTTMLELILNDGSKAFHWEDPLFGLTIMHLLPDGYDMFWQFRQKYIHITPLPR